MAAFHPFKKKRRRPTQQPCNSVVQASIVRIKKFARLLTMKRFNEEPCGFPYEVLSVNRFYGKRRSPRIQRRHGFLKFEDMIVRYLMGVKAIERQLFANHSHRYLRRQKTSVKFSVFQDAHVFSKKAYFPKMPAADGDISGDIR